MIQKRFKLLLVLAALCVSLIAVAQNGHFAILGAQYGHNRRHVDVTQRLRELARRDRPFQVNNKVFGIDPDPGVVKTLRIYVRRPDGREDMFEYREGDVVDGARFNGWGHVEWKGGWNGKW